MFAAGLHHTAVERVLVTERKKEQENKLETLQMFGWLAAT